MIRIGWVRYRESDGEDARQRKQKLWEMVPEIQLLDQSEGAHSLTF